MARIAGLIDRSAASVAGARPTRPLSRRRPSVAKAGGRSARRIHLSLCVVAVAALHLAALAQLAHLPGAAASAPSGSAAPWRHKPVDVVLGAVPAAEPVGTRADNGAALVAEPSSTLEPAPEPHRVSPTTSPGTNPTLPSVQPATAAASTGSAYAADTDQYLPRSVLTKPARPTGPIEINYPEGTPLGDYQAVLLLFVDEEGKVRRLRVRDAGLPYGLERAASEAFLGATFEPGELDGHPVKSIYSVEVSFVATSQPGPVTRGLP
ncbi:MAG: hypothetical protein IPG93_18360 [Burkholderiales bacterium]|nr:hypothetical protein [Burkholderiales bacterium]